MLGVLNQMTNLQQETSGALLLQRLKVLGVPNKQINQVNGVVMPNQLKMMEHGEVMSNLLFKMKVAGGQSLSQKSQKCQKRILLMVYIHALFKSV